MYLENVLRKQVQQENDLVFMQQAISLAKKGIFSTSPNPRVGCVIVQDNTIIARGFHVFAGDVHAEVMALMKAESSNMSVKGATVYVTLEPCNHQGSMPPCTEALIISGISRVVVGSIDPNPLVNSSGIDRLRSSGLEVRTGVLKEACDDLNPGFFKRMQTGFPYVRIKTGASLDGKTALLNGASQWITGKKSRENVHFQRLRSDAVITGIGSVLADNPRMNARYSTSLPNIQPLRIILDSKLRTPPDAALFSIDSPILIACALEEIPADHPLRRHKHVEILSLPDPLSDHVNLRQLLAELGRRGVNEAFVEAGSTLAGAFINQGLFDEILIYLAPCLLGSQARSMFNLDEINNLDQSIRLRKKEITELGEDLCLSFVRENA